MVLKRGTPRDCIRIATVAPEENKTWNSKNSTRELPEDIRRYFIEEAKFLHSNLKQNKLSVSLIDAPYQRFEGHKITIVNVINPESYSSMYQRYFHFRRDRSLNALERLRKSEDNPFRINPYKYDMRFREEIFERLIEGYETEYSDGGRILRIFPNDEVREFFGMERFWEFG